MNNREELENFKTNIDLRQYVAAYGYQRDDRLSRGGSDFMRHPVSDDKIIIKRNANGHYVYVSNRSGIGGTIVDFVKNRPGFSWGALFRELRPWIGEPPVPVPSPP